MENQPYQRQQPQTNVTEENIHDVHILCDSDWCLNISGIASAAAISFERVQLFVWMFVKAS